MRKLKKEVWPHQMMLKSHTGVAEVWCENNLGKRFQDWYSYDSLGMDIGRIYAFKDRETLLLFKIRWDYIG